MLSGHANLADFFHQLLRNNTAKLPTDPDLFGCLSLSALSVIAADGGACRYIVRCGGNWYYKAYYMRTTYRFNEYPDAFKIWQGFRCAQ